MKDCKKCLKVKDEHFFIKNDEICKTCLRKETKFNKTCNRCKSKKVIDKYTNDKRICDDCFILEQEEIFKNKRKCSKCSEEKDLNKFINGRVCNECNNFARKKRIKDGKSKTYPTSKEKMKAWRERNKDRLKIYRKEYSNKKYQTDINYKLAVICRSFISRCLYNKNKERTYEILGYKIDKLKIRLEFQFTKEMTWENYGKYWNIDHIKPICMFKKGTPLSVINMLSNLRPVIKEFNYSKQGRFIS